MNEPIEFEIAEVESCVGNRCVLTGRCYDRPIPLGFVFTGLWRLEPAPEGGASERCFIATVRLTLVNIYAYRKDLDALGEGMTARLTLEGEGLQHLQGRHVLR